MPSVCAGRRFIEESARATARDAPGVRRTETTVGAAGLGIRCASLECQPFTCPAAFQVVRILCLPCVRYLRCGWHSSPHRCGVLAVCTLFAMCALCGCQSVH